jgi:alpha-tubulin suppressor-like RCC1 family protein
MPVDLPSPADLVSCGDHHTLVLLETGQVMAFGLNNHGQLGLGESDFSNQMNTPQPVRILTGECIQIQR